SNVFVGGVTPDQALADLPDEPVARLVRTRVDRDARTVTAAVPLVATRRAEYREGLGCTLTPAEGTSVAGTPATSTSPTSTPVAGTPAEAKPPTTVPADAPLPSRPPSTELWPHGDRVDTDAVTGVDLDRLNAAIDDAFAEPDPDMPRR